MIEKVSDQLAATATGACLSMSFGGSGSGRPTRFPNALGLPVLVERRDDVSTDEIMPVTAKAPPCRSNLQKIADFAFERVDPTHVDHARVIGRKAGYASRLSTKRLKLARRMCVRRWRGFSAAMNGLRNPTHLEKPSLRPERPSEKEPRIKRRPRETPIEMSRGKPLQVGVRVRLPSGATWDQLASMSATEIHDKNLFPRGFYPLPHPNHPEGGMLFPKFEINELVKQEGRDLTRFDLDFDIPDHFLPDFPAPIYLTTRPDLGDASRNKLVAIENYYELFNGNQRISIAFSAFSHFSQPLPSSVQSRKTQPTSADDGESLRVTTQSSNV